MKKSKYPAEQVTFALRQVESDTPLPLSVQIVYTILD